VSGPAAGLAVIVANGIDQAGSFEAFAVAVFLSGLIQIGFSLLRAGIVGNFFPSSVISGMLSAIGLLLILKQIPHAVGLDSAFMGSLEFFQVEDGENTFSELIRSFQVFDLECVIIALASIAIIQIWERMSNRTPFSWMRSIPSALLAVLGGIFLSRYVFHHFGMDLDIKHRLDLPVSGGFQDLVSSLIRPDWTALGRASTYGVAITIAVVGSLESLLSLDATDRIDPRRQNSSKNRELLAQGVSNTLSGFFGGLPVAAVIERTSANVNSGAVSRASSILQGMWLLLGVACVPRFLTLIPLSVLAVILILVGYKLTKPALYKKMYAKGMDQFVPFVVTILAILLTDLLKGVAIGMLVGFVFVIKRSHRKAMIMVEGEGKLFLLRFLKDISFLQKHELILHLRSIPAGATLEVDGGNDHHFDPDIIDVLEEFIEGAEKSSIIVNVKKYKTAVSPFFRG
jgi:MFS superfamily sulfate permease-like transporter